MQELFTKCFSDIKNPRVDRTKKHNLLDIIAIALCAGIPSHDTISRVFSSINAKKFQHSCLDADYVISLKGNQGQL